MMPLSLGVARRIITPPLGTHLYGYNPNIIADSVRDDLTVTAFYFRQGQTQALLVNATLCAIHTDLANRILDEIQERFSIPRDHCMIHAFHTHTGPNTGGEVGWGDLDWDFCNEILLPRLWEAIPEAMAAPVPVKLGAAFGESRIGVNRRQLNADNRVVLGQNPWGCFNPKMSVLSFKTMDDRPVANFVHYGVHCTTAGKNTAISRDWPGHMIDALERETGAVTAFFNGPEGDVGPRMSNGHTLSLTDLRYVAEIGEQAARDALAIYRSISDWQPVPLYVSCGQITLPLDQRPSPEAAEAELIKLGTAAVNLSGLKVQHYRDVIRSYIDGYTEQKTKSFPQTVIRFGQIAFAAFPFELFSEIGMRIHQEAVFDHVLSLALTNGCEGYFVTEDQLCRGGYEVGCFLCGSLQPFAPNADWHLVSETLKNLESNKALG